MPTRNKLQVGVEMPAIGKPLAVGVVRVAGVGLGVGLGVGVAVGVGLGVGVVVWPGGVDSKAGPSAAATTNVRVKVLRTPLTSRQVIVIL